jgi:hypothetical protein
VREINIYNWVPPDYETSQSVATLKQQTPNGPVTITAATPPMRAALQRVEGIINRTPVTPADGDAYLRAVMEVWRGAYALAVEKTGPGYDPLPHL